MMCITSVGGLGAGRPAAARGSGWALQIPKLALGSAPRKLASRRARSRRPRHRSGPRRSNASSWQASLTDQSLSRCSYSVAYDFLEFKFYCRAFGINDSGPPRLSRGYGPSPSHHCCAPAAPPPSSFWSSPAPPSPPFDRPCGDLGFGPAPVRRSSTTMASSDRTRSSMDGTDSKWASTSPQLPSQHRCKGRECQSPH